MNRAYRLGLTLKSHFLPYLSPTRLEAAPAYTAGENETSENKEKDNHHDSETNNEHLQGEELWPVTKVEGEVVHVTAECFLELTFREHPGGDGVQVSQQRLGYHFIFWTQSVRRYVQEKCEGFYLLLNFRQ